MSINRKNADGTYTEVAGVPYVTKENIGLGKVENKSPEELVAMSVEAIKNTRYKNVDAMCHDTNLMKNQIVSTLGYYDINDGGGVNYIITDNNNETGHYEKLDNDLYAMLILSDMIYVDQLGAKGNGEHNDRAAIVEAINLASANCSMYSQFPVLSKSVVFSSKKYLFAGEPIDISTKYGLNLKCAAKYGAIIEAQTGFIRVANAGVQSFGVRGLTIENLTFICDTDSVILKLDKPRNCLINNCVFRSTYPDTTKLCTAIETCTIVDFYIKNTVFYGCKYGINIIEDTYQPQSTTLYVEGCRFTTIDIAINARFVNTDAFIENLNVINSIIEAGTRGISLLCGNKASKAVVHGCHFEYFTQASIIVSKGLLYYDESNFMFEQPGISVGILLYNEGITDIPFVHNGNYISAPYNIMHTDITGITVVPGVRTVIYTDRWYIDTDKQEYTRNAKSISVKSYIPNINSATVEFRNAKYIWMGIMTVNESDDTKWDLVKVYGNFDMVTDRMGGIEAPESGKFIVAYNVAETKSESE